MLSFRNILLIIAGLLVAIALLGWLGLQFQPRPFPPFPGQTQALKTVPLPAGLPAPVERFYKTVYGGEIPVIETVVIQGRGVMKPAMNIPIPARFVFVHNAGKDYRHYVTRIFFTIVVLLPSNKNEANKPFSHRLSGHRYANGFFIVRSLPGLICQCDQDSKQYYAH